jgi:hypothetical protein
MPIVISKVMQIRRREKEEEMDMINVGRYLRHTCSLSKKRLFVNGEGCKDRSSLIEIN